MTLRTKIASPRSMVWQVSGLVHAVADALQQRFNPVAVQGEISGWTQASSGHCYFVLKDTDAQVRCAMFRRAAGLLSFRPKNGDTVELRGRLDVYPARGEMQLIVESMTAVGEGALMERFLALRDRLQAQGLFDPERKKPLPPRPSHIGVVTSLKAAALHDVVTALQRRVPHIGVTVFPASVQGERAVPELIAALKLARQRHEACAECDVLLLVRGGGSMEDLWSFNDEQLINEMLRMPMPVICGVGHESDFTIADFVADLRAPTPTAAAELAAVSQDEERQAISHLHAQMSTGAQRWLDRQWQRLDRCAASVARPSALIHSQQRRLQALEARQLSGVQQQLRLHQRRLERAEHNWHTARLQPLVQTRERLLEAEVQWQQALSSDLLERRRKLERLAWQLASMNPEQVLKRGYAWLETPDGKAVTRASALQPGDAVTAQLSDGAVNMSVRSIGNR